MESDNYFIAVIFKSICYMKHLARISFRSFSIYNSKVDMIYMRLYTFTFREDLYRAIKSLGTRKAQGLDSEAWTTGNKLPGANR